MRLRVNGVEIRVVDRIEIDVDVADGGEELPRGININVHGGELSIRPVPSGDSALYMLTESPLVFHGGASAAIACVRESQDADDSRPAAMMSHEDGVPIPLGNPFSQPAP